MLDWIHTLPEDVAAVKQFVASAAAPAEARTLGAGALGYVVTRLDIVPDWEPTCGVLDDAMVLRVAVALASDKDLGPLPAALLGSLGRLANEADVVAEFLGEELHKKLVRYVKNLAKIEVRKRTPSTIVSDEKARAQLYAEVDQEMKGHPTAAAGDAEKIGRVLKGYFAQKLKTV
jgi:hypothetical protein